MKTNRKNVFLQTMAVLGLAGLSVGISSAQGYYPPSANYIPDRGRHEAGQSPADTTVQHLQRIYSRDGTFSSREMHRYDNALRSLSQFQERWSRGYFDHGKLDGAIADVQNLVNHNPLDQRSRDLLWRDLDSLRQFRAMNGYRR